MVSLLIPAILGQDKPSHKIRRQAESAVQLVGRMDTIEVTPEHPSSKSQPRKVSNQDEEEEDDNSNPKKSTTTSVRKRTKTGCLSALSFAFQSILFSLFNFVSLHVYRSVGASN